MSGFGKFLVSLISIWAGFSILNAGYSWINSAEISQSSPAEISQSPTPKIIRSSTVSKPLKLKDLSLGVKLTSLNVKPITKINADTFNFDYDFFGGSYRVFATVDSAGLVHTYRINISSGLDALKSAIESKYGEQEGTPIGFSCSMATVPILGGLVRSIETCELSRGSEVLRTKHLRVTNPEKPASLAVTDMSEIVLIDTRVAPTDQAIEAARKKAAEIKEKAEQEKRNRDI